MLESIPNEVPKIIVLTDGTKVLVSSEDYEYLVAFKWHGKDYTTRSIGSRMSRMHHEIALRMGLKFKLIDHKDRNPFNNQRENLRVATKSTNGMNRGSQKNKLYSDYKGVSYDRVRQKWIANINVNRIQTNLDRFDTEKEAALTYNKAALRLHGEFAFLNEIC